MRVGNYVVRPDAECWIVATIKTKGKDSKNAGEEYEADIIYPGTFAQALRRLLDRMVRDGATPDDRLVDAVARVEGLYAKIGREVRP